MRLTDIIELIEKYNQLTIIKKGASSIFVNRSHCNYGTWISDGDKLEYNLIHDNYYLNGKELFICKECIKNKYNKYLTKDRSNKI